MIFPTRRLGRLPRGLQQRICLIVEALEDRQTPAQILAGSFEMPSLVDASQAVIVGSNPQVQVVTVIQATPAPALESIPFGFFHPFCRIAFGGGEQVANEISAPAPRPVAPELILEAPNLVPSVVALAEITQTAVLVIDRPALLPEAFALLLPEIAVAPLEDMASSMLSIDAARLALSTQLTAETPYDSDLAPSPVLVPETVAAESAVAKPGLAILGTGIALASLGFVHAGNRRKEESAIFAGTVQ